MQMRATDSHVNEEEEKKYAKKHCNAWITGESHSHVNEESKYAK